MTINATKIVSKKKAAGRIYTPRYIVDNIFDLCDYKGEKILGKHIIDNSCGDGAFLSEAVRRYCEVSIGMNTSADQLSQELSLYIHGIEIDSEECEKCKYNVTKIAASYGIRGVKWDINCADTLETCRYDGKMDYVVGNPPYVRVHNLLDKYDMVKSYTLAQSGMTDLFIVFYEIGLNMLNEKGILGYISPSSFFNSLAGSSLRQHLAENRKIKAIVNLKHFQPFEATTYTAIMILTNQRQRKVTYYEYNVNSFGPLKIAELFYEDFVVNGIYIFGDKCSLGESKKILSYNGGAVACQVKNGFATLYDNFFIGDWSFRDFVIPIVKASTGHRTRCLFPYDDAGRLVPFDKLINDPDLKNHYERHSDKLKNRSLEGKGSWYGFGRSQGINDVYKKKYAINTLIRRIDDIKLSFCPPGTGVYSGLYILTEYNLEDLKSILMTEEFIKYIKILGKYKSGGYYTYSSKDLQRYLNYRFSEREGHLYEQLTIP